MKWVEINRFINENFPEHKGQLMFNMTELARIFGRDRQSFKTFLKEQDVPGYLIGRSKSYCLPEVVEAINGVKWKQRRITK